MLNLIDGLYLMQEDSSDWALNMHCSDCFTHLIKVTSQTPYKFKPTKLPLYYESSKGPEDTKGRKSSGYEVAGLYISRRWVHSWKPLYLERSVLYA